MDDQEIIARFFARDEEGLTAARARYEPYCAAVARSLLNDPRDQEECLSDTWLRAWNSIPPQRPRSLGAFLPRSPGIWPSPACGTGMPSAGAAVRCPWPWRN